MVAKTRSEDADRIRLINQLIDERLLRVVFQPIVDLDTHRVFSYEVLSRPRLEPFKSPLEMIEAAVQAGRIGELGRIVRSLAVDGCSEHPLFINIDPNEFAYGWLVRPDDPIFFHNESVYLEITESVPLSHFEQCHSVLAEARTKGVFLVIDDLGAGYSNLKYISDLEPEVVKLDRQLVSGLKVGSRGFRLVKSIVRLCEDMGAKVVAEGIETVEELGAVKDAGARYGQGYLLGKPGFPPPKPAWPEPS